MDQNYNNIFGDLDLELLDLILKGHFEHTQKVLDAGCGEGRNLIYFLQNNFDLHAIDQDQSAVDLVRFMFKNFNRQEQQVKKASIQNTGYADASMDAVICSRVLHFAENEAEFLQAWKEIHRILIPGGLLYFAMDSMLGFDNNVIRMDNGKWQFTDGSVRFLLHEELLNKMETDKFYQYLSDMKTIHYGNHHAQTIFSLIKLQ